MQLPYILLNGGQQGTWMMDRGGADPKKVENNCPKRCPTSEQP